MKKLVIILFTIALLFSVPALAVDGEVYFGAYLDCNQEQKYVASMEVGQPIPLRTGGMKKEKVMVWNSETERFEEGAVYSVLYARETLAYLRPFGRIETMMDRANGDGTFHPAQVQYEVGMDLNFNNGIYFRLSHTCIHPVDRAGEVESFNLIKVGYRF